MFLTLWHFSMPDPSSQELTGTSEFRGEFWEKMHPKSEFHAPKSMMMTLRKDGRGGMVGSLSEFLGLLSVALNASAVQQAEGTAAWQLWKSRKSGNSTPHLTSSSLLHNTQILMLPFSFSNLNLLRNA